MQRNSDQQEELTTKLHLLRHQVTLIEEELELIKIIDDTEEEIDRLADLSPDANLLRSELLSYRRPTATFTFNRTVAGPQGRTPQTRVPRAASPPRVTTHFDTFPEGSCARFARSSTEKQPHLRGKIGIVVGHTVRFVKLEKDGEVHLRQPHNLTPATDDEWEEQEQKAKVQVPKRKGRRGNRRSQT